MRPGSQTHMAAAAFHEAGHALMALREGRQVSKIIISRTLPGNGCCRTAIRPPNPFSLIQGRGSARAAWRHTFDTTTADIRILLAGPMAEAKATGTSLRSLGAVSDLQCSLLLASRLNTLYAHVSEFADIEPIQPSRLLEEEKRRVRRWISVPKNWAVVGRIACAVLWYGEIDRRQLDNIIGWCGLANRQSTFSFC